MNEAGDIVAGVLRQGFAEGEREVAKKLCRMFFKNDDGDPFELTDGQADIFGIILFKRHRRNQVITSTQYGKSETIAMATDLRAIVFGEDYTILAGDQNKTDIIMGKAIAHLFDHPALEAQIDPLGVPKLERLKHEKSRERITFRDGGSIRTLTADARNRKRVKEVLTGQGARNIIEDEASLIPDDLQAMAMRMLGGFNDSWLLKIGNPFYRNHFLRTWKSNKYFRLFIDYVQALKEGRYGEDFIAEMREEPFFDILYECKFPADDQVVTGGYRRLFSDELIEQAQISEKEYREKYCTVEIEGTEGKIKVPEGEARLGGDMAGGGSDGSEYVMRWPAVMRHEEGNRSDDTMQQVPVFKRLIGKYAMHSSNAAIDYGGLGQGAGDRLHELDVFVNKVMFGGGSPEPKKYKNNRAYMYFQFHQWVKNGGKIVDGAILAQLPAIFYKSDSADRFQIEPKEDLKKRLKELGLTVTSPDAADGAALTFADNTHLIGEDDFEFL